MATPTRASLPPVASLWIGGDLNWMHAFSLQSFVARGHNVTVFFGGTQPPKVPKDVQTRPMTDIWDPASAGHADAPASMLSDLFRLYLLRDTDMIWIDTDMVCLHPLPDTDYMIGYEPTGSVNGAILRLPSESEALNKLITWFSDDTFIPHWLGKNRKQEVAQEPPGKRLRKAFDLVRPSIGPRALQHTLKETHEDEQISAASVYYPVRGVMTDLLFSGHVTDDAWRLPETLTLHLYASMVRRYHREHRPEPNSFIARFADEIGFDLSTLKHQPVGSF